MDRDRCIAPKCNKVALVEIPLESTLTMKKCYCPVCGKIYGVFTPLGKITQVAPAVTAGVILTKFALVVIGAAMGHDGDVDTFH